MLPSDFPNSRVLFFDYDPQFTFQPGFSKSRLTTTAFNILNLIVDVRREEPLRPIVFLSHGLGGILVKYALIKAQEDPRYTFISTATRGATFFGTPQMTQSPGMSLESLVTIFAIQLSLTNPSQLPDSQNDTHILKDRCGDPVLSSVERFNAKWVKGYAHRLRSVVFHGQASSLAVPKSNAILGLSGEQESVVRLAASNHDLWSFQSLSDPNYCIVKNQLAWIFEWIAQSDPIRHDLEVQDLKWLQLLYPLDLRSGESNIQSPAKGTFNWIWTHPSLSSWLQSKRHTTLWISGKPGCGKTTLARHISLSLSPRSNDHIPTGGGFELLSHRSFAIASFFCDYAAPPRTSESVLRSLLHQILTVQPSLLKYVPPPVRQKRRWQDGMSLLLANSLREIARHRRTLLVIDGLDECDQNVRTSLIDALLDRKTSRSDLPASCASEGGCVCRGLSPTLKILATSRQQVLLHDGEDRVAEQISLSSDAVAASGLEKDFQAVMRSSFSPFAFNDKQLALLLPIARQLICAKETAGVFLWASIVVKTLDSYSRRPCTRDTLLAWLTTLPTNPDDLYGSLLQSINAKDGRKRSKALNMLEWITYARRPLSVSELRAVSAFSRGVIPQKPAIVTLDFEFPSKQVDLDTEALRCIFRSGLIEVRDSTVYFAHQSVKEYLKSDSAPTAVSKRFFRKNYKMNVNERLGRLCQQYLISCGRYEYSSHNSSFWTTRRKTKDELPFLSYAAAYWHDHIHVATVQSDVHEHNLMDSFCSPKSQLLQTWFGTWWTNQFKEDWELRRFPAYPTEGIVLSFLGNQSEIVDLLQRRAMKPDEITPKGEEWTPLMAASWSGHESVVDLLLSRHPGYGNQPKHSARALVHAIERGHQTIAQTLTLAFARPTAGPALPLQMLSGGTAGPLATAARLGRLEIVRLLLETGAATMINKSWKLPALSMRETRLTNHRARWCKAMSPMAIAVSHNDIDMLTLLLNHGATLEGFEFLSLAAQTGSRNVLEWLIDTKAGFKDSVDANKALHAAASFNHKAIVTTLLEKGSSIAPVKGANNSPLRYACQAGWGSGSQLLFNLCPVLSEDAFLDACQASSATAVRLFLDAGISANASRRGKTAIHHVLTNHKHVEVPVHERQRLEVLRLLFERGARVNRRDHRGDTCLHRAARRGEMNIAHLLVSEGIQVNAKDRFGNTALDIVAAQGNADWMQSLLDAGARPSSTTWMNVLSSGCAEATTCIMLQSRQFNDRSAFELYPSPPDVYKHFAACGNAPRSFEQALEYLRSRQVSDIHTIQMGTQNEGSVINSIQHAWETTTGRKWAWWPMMPPLPQISAHEAWLSWKCAHCNGKEHRDIVPTETSLEISALVDFLSEIITTWTKELTKRKADDFEPLESISALHNTDAFLVPSRPYEVLEGTVLGPNQDDAVNIQRHFGTEAKSHDHSDRNGYTQESPNNPVQDEKPPSDNKSADSTGEESSEDDDPGDGKELKRKGRFVVVKPGSFPHENIDVGVFLTDNQFLNTLLMVYRQRRGWIKAHFSIYRFHHWSFDKIALSPNGLIIARPQRNGGMTWNGGGSRDMSACLSSYREYQRGSKNGCQKTWITK
ncbi:hypothetical protein CSUB01_06617 [Colletotrichum sublineola]|uniref:NACHT domain-containing protein n=1 Tax=Colletotrichum sublineola TaxID=1173701 RepID=A0A066XJZ8_COLSU|nr:hypothetical protein CSUB01_06617 [Colletotrichum sublineola]